MWVVCHLADHLPEQLKRRLQLPLLAVGFDHRRVDDGVQGHLIALHTLKDLVCTSHIVVLHTSVE